MTLESWSMGIVRPIMDAYPYAWLLFVPFIIFATYTGMNLFIGIMVSAISDAQNSKEEDIKEKENLTQEDILTELRLIRQELELLKENNEELKKIYSSKIRCFFGNGLFSCKQ